MDRPSKPSRTLNICRKYAVIPGQNRSFDISMRNGQNPELAKAAEQANDAATSLEGLSLRKPIEKAAAPETAPAVEEHIDHDFSASSFSFQVERSADRHEVPKQIQTFPRLEQERPREARTLSNNTLKQTKTSATQTRTGIASKSGRRGRGMSLLDRYVSFLAKLIKALEKFLMRRFNRGQAQKQHTQEAVEETESPAPDLTKKKKLPIRHGPGI